MIRVAIIKFPGDDKKYEYLCPNKNIDEGDVVYLEGVKDPKCIYEIKEYEDKDVKTTKKVLSLVKENKNVSLSYKYMDITKAKTDCIVNSLGTNVQIQGGICHSITSASHSKELNDYINNHVTAEELHIEVTPAGDLPSKYIINIVMPYKKHDSHNNQLRKAFCLVIDKAIELKCKSISIPFIGTGANGYEASDVNEAINEVMFMYQYKEGIALNIVLVRYYLEARRYNGRKISSPAISKGIYNLRKNKDKLASLNYIRASIKDNYDIEDEFILDYPVYSPCDIIKEAVKRKGGYTRVPLLNTILNSDARKNISRGKKVIKKLEIYQAAIILKLNFTQLIQLMELSGYTFSISSKDDIDIEVFEYALNNDGFIDDEIYIMEHFKHSKNYNLLFLEDDDTL